MVVVRELRKLLFVILLLMMPMAAHAAEIKVLSSNGITGAMRE